VSVRVLVGHVLDRLTNLPNESVHCVVTSPPYYGLRSYGTEPQVWGGDPNCEHEFDVEIVPPRHSDDGVTGSTLQGGKATQAQSQRQSAERGFCHCGAWRGDLGLEPNPELFICHLVEIFHEVRRVLRKDGTLWLNIGDSYSGTNNTNTGGNANWGSQPGREVQKAFNKQSPGVKPKDLMMLPAQLALALRADRWWLRSEIVWAKRAPMPESCTDRPTCAHEKVFLLTKSGSPTFWTHRDHEGTRTKPAPDYRWIDHATEDRAEYEGKWKDADQQSAGRRLLLNVRAKRAAGNTHDAPFAGNEPLLPETDVEPPNWKTELLPDGKAKRWSRINLWAAHDYFYDAEAVKEEAQSDHPSGNSFVGRQGTAEYRPRTTDSDGPRRTGGEGGPEWNGVGGKRNMRNVWTLGPSAFPGAHFATFHPEIPRRAILAGTSARGVCPKCGAPWVRVVETEKVKCSHAPGKGKGARTDFDFPGGGVSDSSCFRTGLVPVSQTIGWRPSCSCNAGQVVPATVLEPFLGSGTTALVADQLGRDCIGIELAPSYAAMSERRVRDDAGMFAQIAAE
jgi:DNA modification methylase